MTSHREESPTYSKVDNLCAHVTRFNLESMENLPFDQRACFIAGAAKSGTTLLVSLLDSHPELLVMPQDTAYFPTVLTKYGPRGRRAQFDYLTKESWTNVLFGFQAMRGRQDYAEFPKQKFLETFQRVAFDPANANRDLLVLMMECSARTNKTLGRKNSGQPQLCPGDLQSIPESEAVADHARSARAAGGADCA